MTPIELLRALKREKMVHWWSHSVLCVTKCSQVFNNSFSSILAFLRFLFIVLFAFLAFLIIFLLILVTVVNELRFWELVIVADSQPWFWFLSMSWLSWFSSSWASVCCFWWLSRELVSITSRSFLNTSVTALVDAWPTPLPQNRIIISWSANLSWKYEKQANPSEI